MSTLFNCKEASIKLQLSYEYEFRSENRPAGCYWGGPTKSYFNSIVNPLSTNNGSFSDRGGICHAGM